MKGAAVPYGSRSTQSTLVVRWLYMSVQASPSVTLTLPCHGSDSFRFSGLADDGPTSL